MKKLILLLSLATALGTSGFAQDNPLKPLDVSAIPASAAKPDAFAHAGWKVEEVVKGDLNGDGKEDAAIKIAQIEEGRESGIGGDRALVIVLDDGGTWKRVAIADKLLQCVDCGGAFYGVMPAPAAVTIEKGVIVVENEHGSRNVDKSTFRFRLDIASGRFVLIGYDFADNDRNTGEWSSESTNYLTNVRISKSGSSTKSGKEKPSSTSRSKIKHVKIFIEDVDGEEMEGKALKHFGLG